MLLQWIFGGSRKQQPPDQEMAGHTPGSSLLRGHDPRIPKDPIPEAREARPCKGGVAIVTDNITTRYNSCEPAKRGFMPISIRCRDKNRSYKQIPDKKIMPAALVLQVSYMANITILGYYKEPYKHCYAAS